jgi:hypothetical protein
MYKLNSINGKITSVNKIEGNTIMCIPFNEGNTDYANFKKDLANSAELQDPDGKVIDGLAYLATLDKEQQ